jgi:arylsulfatase A-like enzyme/Tfp pilus assembly protein PilF
VPSGAEAGARAAIGLGPGVALAALAAALVTASGCRARDQAPWPRAPVVLVSIDTLRADRLPLYGYGSGATPHIDALGRESVVFEDAYSHCPLTLPAHASMLTGLLPARHGVRDNAGFTLEPGASTLASRLSAAGYATGAAVSSYVLRAGTGIARGFDAYDDAIARDVSREDMAEQQRDGAAAVESLLRWIEAQGGRPYFAFLHLYEPHTPYSPPPPHRERFAGRPYDGEVAYADELVGRFLGRLRARGDLDRAVVAVTSDHGEGLGDHGEQEHGLFLYREAVRVPLVVRLPGGARAGTRVRGAVAQVDLPATLLDLVSLPADGMDGVSLRTALGGRGPGRPVYSETFFPRFHFGWSELYSAADDRYRYVRAPRPELFDVASDPAETRNRLPELAGSSASLAAWLDGLASAGVPAPAPVDAATRERLEALGYVGGGTPATPSGALADPKDKVAVLEAFKRAVARRREGNDEQAVVELRAVLADSPGMLDAWETLGLSLARLGRTPEAIRALEKAVAIDPSSPASHLGLARIHALAGRADLLETHALAAAARGPGEAYELLAELRLRQGRLEEAAECARRSLEADARRVVGHVVLAAVARRAGRCEDAIGEYRRAAEAQAGQRGLVVPGIRSGTADCLARLGRDAEAEREFQAEIALVPHSREGRVGLATLYRSQGRDAEARSVLEGVVSAHPRPGADEHWVVVHTARVLGDEDEARAWAARARGRYPRDARFR